MINIRDDSPDANVNGEDGSQSERQPSQKGESEETIVKSEMSSKTESLAAEPSQDAAEDGKKKKGKKDKPEDKKAKKGPGKKTIAAMQEALKKIKVLCFAKFGSCYSSIVIGRRRKITERSRRS